MGFIAWMIFSVLLIIADQVSKLLVLKQLNFGDSHYVNSFLNIVLVYNKGAAFSFLANAGGWQRWFFTCFGVLAAVFIITLLKKHYKQHLFATGLTFVMSGAIGNVIDRIMYGHVIDFIDFHIGQLSWPAFNVADSLIVMGVSLLFWDELKRVKKT